MHAGQADKQAPAFAALQQAFLLDLTDGFAHRRAVHAEALGQLLFGRQRRAKRQGAAKDRALDLRRNGLVGRLDGHAAKRLGCGAGFSHRGQLS
jgi:hypothetical protein